MKNVSITEYTDWRDTEETLNSIKNSLAELGIIMIDNPDVEGSDQFSWVILKQGFTKVELETEVQDELVSQMGNPLPEGEMERRDDIVSQVYEGYIEHVKQEMNDMCSEEDIQYILDKAAAEQNADDDSRMLSK